MDTMQQMARSFSTRLVQMGMAYESTVESADNRKIFQNFENSKFHGECFSSFETESSPFFRNIKKVSKN